MVRFDRRSGTGLAVADCSKNRSRRREEADFWYAYPPPHVGGYDSPKTLVRRGAAYPSWIVCEERVVQARASSILDRAKLELCAPVEVTRSAAFASSMWH